MTSPWLSRLPAGLFAIPFGLFGLSGAWRRTASFHWFGTDCATTILFYSATAMLLMLGVLYAAKCMFYPAAVKTEYLHPVQGSILALIPMTVLIAAVNLAIPDSLFWLCVVLIAVLVQAIIALRIAAMLANGLFPAAAVTPALYLPTVGGGLVGGMALAVLDYHGFAVFFFGMGLVCWAILEARVLNRLFEGSMPPALRPTIGVELAAPGVTTLAASIIWPALPADILLIGMGIAAGPIVTVLARYRWWSSVPFSSGFWSFSFPLAALASACVEVVRRGGWPPFIAGIPLTIASAAILFLAIRTVILLVRGQLLPIPVPTHTNVTNV